MNCNGTIQVNCEKCGMNQSIPCSILNEWQEVSEDTGAQGREVQNQTTGVHACTICQNEIEVTATIWTYPDAPAIKPDCFDVDNVSGAEFIDSSCNCS